MTYRHQDSEDEANRASNQMLIIGIFWAVLSCIAGMFLQSQFGIIK